MHRPPLHLLLLLLLAMGPGLAACGELPAARSSRTTGDAKEHEGPAKANTDAGKDDEDDDEEKDDLREELQDAKSDLAKARLDVEISRLEAMHGERRDTVAAEDARKDRDEAQLRLDTWLASEKAERLARLELDLEQGRDRLFQSEQELKELEAMYAAEDFASMTKELVLHRGRKQVEFARRELALDEGEAQRTRDVEIPLEESEKRRAVEKAQETLIAANEDHEKQRLDRVMRVSDAARTVDDLRRKIRRLDRKLGTKTDVGPPAGSGPVGPEDVELPPEAGLPGGMPPGGMPPPGGGMAPGEGLVPREGPR